MKFLVLKTKDWNPMDYILKSIVPYGWVEDNNRAIPSNEEIIGTCTSMEQLRWVLDKLNNKALKE